MEIYLPINDDIITKRQKETKKNIGISLFGFLVKISYRK